MKKLTTKQILQQNKKRMAPSKMQQTVVILHDIRSMHNVGAAFRCADAFGIKKILLSGVTPAPPRPEITKTAIGAEEFVDWEQIDDFENQVNRLTEQKYTLVGLEQTTNSVLLPDYKLPTDKKMCLVFGNEVTGINEEILPFINDFVEIPQYGNKHSLNVSVTVGIGLYGFLTKSWK
ncbi:MAG TPA: TrmH family RNA methyltransferase [Balneolaceae bacterium]|nr:TrmH family RNA methyltransferase [Balneolaceae bacterium]